MVEETSYQSTTIVLMPVIDRVECVGVAVVGRRQRMVERPVMATRPRCGGRVVVEAWVRFVVVAFSLTGRRMIREHGSPRGCHRGYY